MGDFFISVTGLKNLLDSKNPPFLFDVRKADAYAQSGEMLPGAAWRDHAGVNAWAREIPPGTPVVVYCVHGHEVSQGAGSALRELGVDARVLEGGFEGWCETSGEVVPVPPTGETRP